MRPPKWRQRRALSRPGHSVGRWVSRLNAKTPQHLADLLTGWDVFNLVEGLIDHQLLGIHHVRDDVGAPIGWDLGFLAFGALLVVIGLALARTRGRRSLLRAGRRHRLRCLAAAGR